MTNIFSNIPQQLDKEIFESIVNHENIRIDRIVSSGQTSPAQGWYDQNEHEWVIVLKGNAIILFEDQSSVTLNPGDYLNIPAHKKHKVSWTNPNETTLWLAIHY